MNDGIKNYKELFRYLSEKRVDNPHGKVIDVNVHNGTIDVDVPKLVTLAGENKDFNNYLRTHGDSKRWLVNLETVYHDMNKSEGLLTSIVSKEDLVLSVEELKKMDEFYFALDEAGELSPLDKIDVLMAQRLKSFRYSQSLLDSLGADCKAVRSAFDQKGNYHFSIVDNDFNTVSRFHVPFNRETRRHDFLTNNTLYYPELMELGRSDEGHALEISEEFAGFIVENYNTDSDNLLEGSFFHKGEDGSYVGIDNLYGECNVEVFADKETCVHWIANSDFEYQTNRDFGVVIVDNERNVAEIKNKSKNKNEYER